MEPCSKKRKVDIEGSGVPKGWAKGAMAPPRNIFDCGFDKTTNQ